MEPHDYYCPYCKGQLKAHQKIILASRRGDGQRGLLLFNPKLGEYDILKHESYELKEGEHLDILCPLCHANLTDKTISDNLARILMSNKQGQEFHIYFSEIVGMKCTYKITGDDIEAFGEDAQQFINHWGAAPRY